MLMGFLNSKKHCSAMVLTSLFTIWTGIGCRADETSAQAKWGNQLPTDGTSCANEGSQRVDDSCGGGSAVCRNGVWKTVIRKCLSLPPSPEEECEINPLLAQCCPAAVPKHGASCRAYPSGRVCLYSVPRTFRSVRRTCKGLVWIDPCVAEPQERSCPQDMPSRPIPSGTDASTAPTDAGMVPGTDAGIDVPRADAAFPQPAVPDAQ